MTRISSVPRRLVLVCFALVLVTTAWARPAQAAESKDVNVVNTPTVNARQSGAWDVGIDRVRVPFQKSLSFVIPGGEYAGLDDFVVPAGHRLVIEQVTARLGLLTDQVAWAEVTTSVGGVLTAHFIPVTSTPGGQLFVACQQVRLYADPETEVRFVIFRNTVAGGDKNGNASISGYLIPMQP
jgi:hypothetical protein